MKKHIIKNFLHLYYKNVKVAAKKIVIKDLSGRSWFPVEYDYGADILTMDIGEKNKLSFKFAWTVTDNDGLVQYRLDNVS